MKVPPNHGGFALVTVLIVTGVGLLFGAGSLLLFRYQCQRRIDRQHELEKVYAVRSAANYAKVAFVSGDSGKQFKYQTSSGRELGLLVKPVEYEFPDFDNPAHLDIHNEGKNGRVFRAVKPSIIEQYDVELDYEFGAMSNDTVLAVSEEQIRTTSNRLVFPDTEATDAVRWWVNIGMKDTRGWLQEDYGMRYSFIPRNYGPGNGDVLRLAVIRNTNHLERAGKEWIGCRRGWPLSTGEYALVLEVDSAGLMTLYEYSDKGKMIRRQLNGDSTCEMGFQVSGRKVYLFYTSNELDGSGYKLSDYWEMPVEPEGIFDYFSRSMRPDSSGKEPLGALRAVIECVAMSSKRPYRKTSAADVSGENTITSFAVTPTYQYDVFVKYRDVWVPATVVQKIGSLEMSKLQAYGKAYYYLDFDMRTYDTHGTAWKGHRKYEKE